MFNIIFFSLLSASVSLEITNQKKPVIGQAAELLTIHGQEAGEPLRCTTDKRGRCRFTIDKDAHNAHIARTIYEGLQYVSEPFRGDSAPKKISLEVYSTRQGVSDLILKERQILLIPNAQGLQVEDELVVMNTGSYVALGDNQRVIEFALPQNAHDLHFEMGFSQADTQIEGNRVTSSRPLLPGESRFAFRYQLEAKRGQLSFESTTNLPLSTVYLAYPPQGLKLQGLNLAEQGWKFIDDTRFLTAQATLQSPTLTFSVSGLPWNIRWAGLLPLLSIVFFIALYGTKAPAMAVLDDNQRSALVAELRNLKTLKAKHLIHDSEYQKRRVLVMRALAPYYSTLT